MEESWACLPAYLLLLLVIVASAPTFPDPEEYEDYEGVYLEDDNATGCINGLAEEDLSCLCHPCWGGVRCQSYEDNYAPRFLVHAATAVVPENITGSVYRAWATDGDLGLTCPLGGEQVTRCPCAAVTYQLFAAPGDHRFALHHTTGVLSRNLSGAALMPGQSYTYKLMVQTNICRSPPTCRPPAARLPLACHLHSVLPLPRGPRDPLPLCRVSSRPSSRCDAGTDHSSRHLSSEMPGNFYITRRT
ncbi:uncharacterized protein LOC135106496 isoform X3 [Scylla paramamosain]|uniref:uncharacterized protein LOC135106496 isoform X3 n=1 Tax=Scylla paramamosain TaxID=85552 RepID=UPI0030839B97